MPIRPRLPHPELRTALLDAWAVLSPVSCAGCGADDRALCSGCLDALEAAPRSHNIPVAGEISLAVESALDYEGPVRRMILAFKEQSRTDVSRALGRALQRAILAGAEMYADGPVELAAVPTSRSSYRVRGFDPVRELLRGARMPHSARILQHVRSTASQKTLDRDLRASNLHQSLRARPSLEGRSFLIVDDVVTTGATLIEARRAITAAGGRVIGAATLAYTPRRFGSPEARRFGVAKGMLNG